MDIEANGLSLRRATLGKLKRDAHNVRQYARFVIVLKEDRGADVEVIDNGKRREKDLPYARLVAVLGPVHYKDVSLVESVLMEVGYSRTRPYAQLEERPKDGNGHRSNRRWHLKPRIRARTLSDEELALVYPHIVRCMAAIVLEQRERWRTKGRWWVNGPGMVERGIYFTISHSDRLLLGQMIREDVRYRKRKYISGHAARIRSLLRTYKYSHYTSKQVRSFSKTRLVADVLSQVHYTPFYRAVLCRHFTEGSHIRSLLDLIVETFKIDVSLTEQEEYVLDLMPVVLPTLRDLQCYRLPKQPTIHARGASVFELTLERKYKEEMEIPF